MATKFIDAGPKRSLADLPQQQLSIRPAHSWSKTQYELWGWFAWLGPVHILVVSGTLEACKAAERLLSDECQKSLKASKIELG
jgi:hypothetical protein